MICIKKEKYKKGGCVICEICRQIPCHPSCPNYVPPQATHHCSICKEGIYEGEEYIENDLGRYAHMDCFYGTRDLLEWLECEIKTMKKEY